MLYIEHLQRIGNCYSKGDFTSLFDALAEDCTWESDWRTDKENGKEEICTYYRYKGSVLQRCDLFPTYTLVELYGSQDSVLGCGIYLKQIIGKQISDLILLIHVATDGKITHIHLCMKELFRFRNYDISQSRY